jgi:hypothetical protein
VVVCTAQKHSSRSRHKPGPLQCVLQFKLNVCASRPAQGVGEFVDPDRNMSAMRVAQSVSEYPRRHILPPTSTLLLRSRLHATISSMHACPSKYADLLTTALQGPGQEQLPKKVHARLNRLKLIATAQASAPSEQPKNSCKIVPHWCVSPTCAGTFAHWTTTSRLPARAAHLNAS